jgi:hypothetical protein
MGGNALTVPSRRITKDEYLVLESKVFEKLRQRFSDVRNILYYRDKKDFGDMDILIAKDGTNNEDTRNYLLSEFGSKEVVCNTDVISFELDGFQIDLIFTEPDDMEAAAFYYSQCDANNIIGRIANQFGLKFGHTGLVYVNRGQSGNIMNKVVLTKDPVRIYEFLGYDYETYAKGFDTLEQIFDFIIAGKYFSKEIFEYENLNHQNRTRNRKRKTYQQFLEYISTLNIYYEFKEEYEYLNHIDSFFPEVGLKSKLLEFVKEELQRMKMKEKFSGKIVISIIPELKDNSLGLFIEKYKSSKESFDDYVQKTKATDIKKDILAFYTNLNSKN